MKAVLMVGILTNFGIFNISIRNLKKLSLKLERMMMDIN
jgi:hypothetical protein